MDSCLINKSNSGSAIGTHGTHVAIHPWAPMAHPYAPWVHPPGHPGCRLLGTPCTQQPQSGCSGCVGLTILKGQPESHQTARVTAVATVFYTTNKRCPKRCKVSRIRDTNGYFSRPRRQNPRSQQSNPAATRAARNY